MSDYDSYGVEPMYRKYVLVANSVTGFVIVGLVFFGAMDSIDAEVSVRLTEAFIGMFIWVGGVITNVIYSVDDGWYTWTHGWPLLKGLRLGILSIGALLVAILTATEIRFPGPWASLDSKARGCDGW